jgi:hypothetical protein
MSDYTKIRCKTITIRCDVCGEEWRPYEMFHFEAICLCTSHDVLKHTEDKQ